MASCICEKCAHFVQHYSFDTGHPRKIFCGHCMKTGRNCNISSTHTKCDNYKPDNSDLKTKIIHDYIINNINDIHDKLNNLKHFIEKDA